MTDKPKNWLWDQMEEVERELRKWPKWKLGMDTDKQEDHPPVARKAMTDKHEEPLAIPDFLRNQLNVLRERDAEIARLERENAELRKMIADLNDVIEDTRRLTRELDVAMHGEDGAAKQASLCDLIVPAQRLRERLEKAEKRIKDLERESSLIQRSPFLGRHG